MTSFKTMLLDCTEDEGKKYCNITFDLRDLYLWKQFMANKDLHLLLP